MHFKYVFQLFVFQISFTIQHNYSEYAEMLKAG